MFWEIIEGIHSQTKQKALGDSLYFWDSYFETNVLFINMNAYTQLYTKMSQLKSPNYS